MIPAERMHLYNGVAPVNRDIPAILNQIANDRMLLGYVQINGKSTPAYKVARSCTNFIALWICNRFGTAAKMCERLARYPGMREDAHVSSDVDVAIYLLPSLRLVQARHRWVSPHTVDHLHDNLARLEESIFHLPRRSPLHSVAGFVNRYRTTPMKAFYNDHSHDRDQRS